MVVQHNGGSPLKCQRALGTSNRSVIIRANQPIVRMSSSVLPLALAQALEPNESACPVPSASRYWVTNHGRVFSLVNGLHALRPCPNARGYLCVSLWRDTDRDPALAALWPRYVHELVAFTFISARPVITGVAYEIDHIDSDKANNHVSNLRYITKSENLQRAIAAGRNPTTKLTAVAVWTLRCQALVHGDADVVGEAVERYGATTQTVRNALSGRAWAVVPDPVSQPTLSDLARALMLSNDEARTLLRLSPFSESYVPVERVARIIPLQPSTDRRAA